MATTWQPLIKSSLQSCRFNWSHSNNPTGRQGNVEEKKVASVWDPQLRRSRTSAGLIRQALQCENGSSRRKTSVCMKSTDDSASYPQVRGWQLKENLKSWEPLYLSERPQRRTSAKSVKSADLGGSGAFPRAAYQADIICFPFISPFVSGRGARARVRTCVRAGCTATAKGNKQRTVCCYPLRHTV